MTDTSKRPDWLTEEWDWRAYHAASYDLTCLFCENEATHEAMSFDSWSAWCDSPDCESAAREAIESE